MTPIWEIDTAITTATARVTVVERAMEETEYRTEATAGMGVHRGVKGNHPTLTTTNTESGSIAATRLTVAELDHADYRGRGGLYLGNIGNRLVNKYDIHKRKNLRGLENSLIAHSLQCLAMRQVTYSHEASGYLHINDLTLKIEASSYL